MRNAASYALERIGEEDFATQNILESFQVSIHDYDRALNGELVRFKAMQRRTEDEAQL